MRMFLLLIPSKTQRRNSNSFRTQFTFQTRLERWIRHLKQNRGIRIDVKIDIESVIDSDLRSELESEIGSIQELGYCTFTEKSMTSLSQPRETEYEKKTACYLSKNASQRSATCLRKWWFNFPEPPNVSVSKEYCPAGCSEPALWRRPAMSCERKMSGVWLD